MADMHVQVSSAWKKVDALHVKVSGTWKAVNTAYVKVGGAWKEFFQFVVYTLSGEVIVSLGAGDQTAGIRFNADGTVDKETTGGGFQQIDSATDWVIPTASRTGSERVRAVATPPGDDWTSEAAVPGTWVDISTNPRWYLTDDEAVGLDTGNVTFQIDDGAGNVLTSGVYLCNATEL